MPNEIRKLAERHLYDPVTVKVKAATLTIDTVEQFYVETKAQDKVETLARVLESERPEQAIVFARTKIRTEQLYRTLRDKGMNVKALHGDMSQGSRDGVMISFKGGRVPILVATDVAARGLDISTVTHIVNFDVPTSPDVYVHRIGRTGRVGRSGRAITFVEPRQRRELEAIERHASTTIAPWAEGARVAPTTASEPRPRRHRKPHDAIVTNGGGYTKLIATAGRHEGVEAADLIAAMTAERPGRRGDPQRPRARALRAAGDPGRRRRPDHRARDRGPGQARALSNRSATEEAKMSVATMSTNHGDITIELFDEDAPKTVDNFKKLAADGFYDGLIFHRIIKDFMIQGGCPQGTGTGGPGYTFEDEINEHKVVRGSLAMANAGPNTNGSQFFIVTLEATPWLDGKHTVFGQVTDGMDVVDKLEGLPTDGRDKPREDAKIEKLTIT